MNDPELYAQLNQNQAREAQMMLNKFGERMRLLADGDRVLDIGCGIGSVTRDMLMPVCQKARMVVGADISTSMIDYANSHFAEERLVFRTMDIGKKESCNEILVAWGPFHHIYSFYCLHWVKDQVTALRNIYSLLSTDGECLLLAVAQTPIFDMYRTMSRSPTWEPYMKDVENFIPDAHNSENPAADFSAKMKLAGLKVLSCEAIKPGWTFDNVHLKDFLQAVSPFYQRIPDSRKADFMEECVQEMYANDEVNISMQQSCCLPYCRSYLIAHARRTGMC